jgi:hypothetical protein
MKIKNVWFTFYEYLQIKSLMRENGWDNPTEHDVGQFAQFVYLGMLIERARVGRPGVTDERTEAEKIKDRYKEN